MSTLSDTFHKFDETVKSSLSFLDNKYASAILALVLILYASMAAPKLSPSIAKLFDSNWVKLLFFFLIAFYSKKDPTVAIIAAIAVLVSLQTLSRHKFNFKLMGKNTMEEGQLSHGTVSPWNEENQNESQWQDVDYTVQSSIKKSTLVAEPVIDSQSLSTQITPVAHAMDVPNVPTIAAVPSQQKQRGHNYHDDYLKHSRSSDDLTELVEDDSCLNALRRPGDKPNLNAFNEANSGYASF